VPRRPLSVIPTLMQQQVRVKRVMVVMEESRACFQVVLPLGRHGW